MKEKIRIGLLVEDNQLPAWSYEMLNKIKKMDFAEVVVIVKKNKTKATVKRNFFKKLSLNWNRLLFVILNKIENKYNKITYDAFEKKNLDDLFPSTPRINVTPESKKYTDRFTSNDILKLKEYRTDVLIRLGFAILKGEILNVPKYGIWSYHHGNNFINRGGPPGVWEVLNNEDTSGVTLQILTEDLDAGHVLYNSFSSTDDYSFRRNKNNMYWKSASFIPRLLKKLHNEGESDFFNYIKSLNQHPVLYSNRLYRTPGNKELLSRILFKYSSEIRKRIYHKFYMDQWILLFHFSKSRNHKSAFYKYKKIIPPKDRFWADPHVLFRNDKYYIFIEEYMYKRKKAHISVITMEKDGSYTSPEIVLDKDYHLSYPFVFEDGGKTYMIPESKQNKTIELYECVDFPAKWKPVKVLMKDISAVDTTIIKFKGKYWMFTNIAENQGASSCDELFVFYSDSLVTENWNPHPLNPVITDVRVARPAGKIFIHNDKLYRPSQDCSKRYGYGINLNVINQLDEHNYDEETINSVRPNWDKSIICTHTYSEENQLTVIDGVYKRIR